MAGQGVEHPFDTIIVGKDDRVVEDGGRRCATASQHPRERKSNQRRDLLSRACPPAGR